jgi:hypothetical protein
MTFNVGDEVFFLSVPKVHPELHGARGVIKNIWRTAYLVQVGNQPWLTCSYAEYLRLWTPLEELAKL